MANKVEFGLLLAQYRTRYGWSQSELAAKIGMSRGAIVSWEDGGVPNARGVVMRMAEELQLSKEERKGFLQAAGMSVEHWPAEYWQMPSQYNPYFVGRETVLQALRQTLVPGAKATALTQSISGLGGVGKTQVAIKYAHRYGEFYEAVFWIQADSQEGTTAEYLRLATQVLGLPEQPEAEHQIAAVKRWLQKRHGWLLIFDNVENPQDILFTFVPTKHQGSVLLTTRRRDVGTLAHNEMLPVFSEDEAILFLLRRAKHIGRTAEVTKATPDDFYHARELCELLGWLPLALDQAGAYIEENGCSLQHYLDLYQQFKPKLLDRRKAAKDYRGNDDHPESVFMTFWLSWDQIQQRNLLAGRALEFCAFLAPNQIPEQLVLDGLQRRDATNLPDTLEMDEALGLLYRYSLIERADYLLIERMERTLSLHRLVQEMMQEVLTEEERLFWMERAIQVVNAVFPSGEYGTWSESEFLLPHALMCAKWLTDIQQKPLGGARLLNDTGYYLHRRAQYRKAELLFQRALTIWEEQLGPSHPLTATSLNNLATLYQDQGCYEKAELLLQRTLVIRDEQLGPSHPDTAVSLNNLAVLYQDQGRYEKAEPLYQRALTMKEEQLGPSHPHTATSLNNLALLYQAQGRYEKAEPLFQRALAIVEEHLGPSHPDTAASLNNLATLYQNQGCYEKAEPLYQHALAMREEQLGPSHPHTATSLNNLALLYQAQGRYEKAEPLFQRALAIVEEHLGPSHPHIAANLNNLAILYQDQKCYEKAEPLYQRALTMKEKQLGPSHPHTAISLNNLAMLYRAQGRYEKAEPLFQRALAIAEEHLGSTHPHTAVSLNNLALLYQDQGRYEKAEPLFQRALAIAEEQLGSSHPNTAISLGSLATFYHAQRRYEEAEPLYQRAVNISFVSLGEKHPQTQQLTMNYLKFLSHRYTNGDIDALLRLLQQRKQDGHSEDGEIAEG